MPEAFDLDAEIAAGAEAPRHDTADAVQPSDASVTRILEGARLAKVDARMVAKLRRAMKGIDSGDYPAAARQAFKALEMAPDDALANHVMGLCLDHLGRLSKALEFYERAWKLDPKNPEIYLNLGMAAWKLDMLDGAEKFLRIFADMSPGAPAAMVNLGGILRDQGRFEDSIELLRAAIYSHQDNADLWNSLGTTLLDSGDPEQASTFYHEALRLKPGYARAHHNLAFTFELRGDPEAAIRHFSEARKDPGSARDYAIMTHGLALASLTAGELESGWSLYDIRLDANFPEATLFVIDPPMWDGRSLDDIRGKTLLVIGEQGLGDEVLFMNMLGDLKTALGEAGELRVACERRLRPLVKRAFPDAVVGRHHTINREGRDIRTPDPGLTEDGKVDFWAPMAQPAVSLRPRREDFPDTHHLKADPEKVDRLTEQLARFGAGLKVGILWKSLKMTAKRKKAYSPFETWKTVLKTQDACFVNLQYGEVDEELRLAREEHGVVIHTVEGVDLKDDLDDVAALCKACDVVIGPMNATTNISAAVGAETWIIHSRPKAWTMLGAGHLPWYPTARSYTGAKYRDFDGALKAIARDLRERAANG
ncbi:MAG: tetratricopeptide repeat protein [Pseudomonadota bacterium]